MAIINLREHYPWYDEDKFIEVPDVIIEIYGASVNEENAHNRRKYRNKAHYSLDCGDGIESSVVSRTANPCDDYEDKLMGEQLRIALDALPEKQARRVYAHVILKMNYSEIARAEKVHESSVRESVKAGLRRMEKFLKNIS
jgi:RNA polymerase sigma-70 factor (ECF subfamily)